MFDAWTAQTWIAAVSATISVAGAVASWSVAYRKYQFDRYKEFSTLRSETSQLLRTALTLSHPTWSAGYTAFSAARMEWWDQVESKRLIIPKNAYTFLYETLVALTKAEEEAFGVRRVTTGDPNEDDTFPEPMSTGTTELLRLLEKRLRQDPWLVAK